MKFLMIIYSYKPGFFLLNGGYNVHPVPPPNSEIKERIMKRYETKRIKIEKLLTWKLRQKIEEKEEKYKPRATMEWKRIRL